MSRDPRRGGRVPSRPGRPRHPGGRDRGPALPTFAQTRRPLPEPLTDDRIIPWRPPADANLGLWLDKWVPLEGDPSWRLRKELRSYVLTQMFCRQWRSTAGRNALERQREHLRGARGTVMQELVARVEGRLIVDHGRTSTVETTLSFHHTWGVPRIPGSAIKGLVRAEMEATNVPAERVDRLLGVDQQASSLPAAAGAITFFDALPEEGCFCLDLDVLTPHFKKYYEGTERPGDWQSPEPHTFLAVVDTRFVFHALARPSVTADDLAVVRQALVDGLEWLGVGGKRSAGYGRLVEEVRP